MANPQLNSLAETRALIATDFEGFGINLSEVKRTTTELLGQIGKHGFFEEYSKHDISHIDEVLKLAEWLIDDETKGVISDADWFLITLSIYFHDMGMLVTRDEFKNRQYSAYDEFCSTELVRGPHWPEYKARIDELSSQERDVFLYQEFVRFNHAARVRHWIEGSLDLKLGVAEQASCEVMRILSGLDPTLRRDLGLIAESHHLDDLDDYDKYKLVQPYGSSDNETANLQYCAVILRAADLLHMRRDRTPSVLFRIINPTDPISQREWAKQNAVRRVMPRKGLNDEGLPDDNAIKDTIDVYARFSDENGFFGLTSFLNYAEKELRRCNDWVEKAKKTNGMKYSFHWRKISDDKIETEGFLREKFSFNLDQDKILDLLIGHTLYNDTSVVLRELAQNGLDAIRLQEEIDRQAGSNTGAGHLRVEWNSDTRLLTVADNGTGMTQEIIEKHLLRVGSSRYQDKRFQEQYPNFSPISRFGIGVLSAFMIADQVEITTCSPLEPSARKISLRSVHGRYLVRLLDKGRDAEATSLYPHGTAVTLKVRNTARLQNVLDLVRRWVVFPNCRVTVAVDGQPVCEIGYRTAADAVQGYLTELGLSTQGDEPDYRVISQMAEGVEFAYAAKWSAYFHEWSIATAQERLSRHTTIPCTCVEGIAVVFTTPGMDQRNLIAVANATGKGAPKTNVARSTLEATAERDLLYSKLYGMYADHVRDEIKRLISDEHYSLTRAISSAIYLLPLGLSETTQSAATLPGEFQERMKELPLYIVERNQTRLNVNLNDLKNSGGFWTIDSELVRSTEFLLREVRSDATVSKVVDALGDQAQTIPQQQVLYNFAMSSTLSVFLEKEFEPREIHASEELRRVDMLWEARVPGMWVRLQDIFREVFSVKAAQRVLRLRQLMDSPARRRANVENLWLAQTGPVFRGADEHAGVGSMGRIFFRPDIPITKFLLSLKSETDELSLPRMLMFATIFINVAELEEQDRVQAANVTIKQIGAELGDQFTAGREAFIGALAHGPYRIFDTSRWQRGYYT